MLSTRFSLPPGLRAGVVSLGLALLAACATPPRPGEMADDGVAVDLSQPVKVALLVPGGSSDPSRERIAQSLVNAARLAQSDLRDASLDLRVYTTGGTPEGGNSAAAQAVADGAAILVGPLFSTATAGAQPVARQAGLNVLSFSNNATVAGDGVYLLGMTFENAAQELVEYALANGLNDLAVVYPEGLEGETARQAVAAAARRSGANLVGSEAYSLSRAGIEAAAGPIVANLQAAGADAVILTDGPTGGLAFISEALRNRGLSPAGTQFLGMQRWDVSAEALSQPSLQGGVFTAPDPGSVAGFEARYASAFGEQPHDLAGLAYDGIAAVGAMIAEARAQGGSPFSTARLTQPEGFAGVNGPFRFTADGLNERNLAMIAVRDGQPVVIERAARSFDAAGF